MLGPATELNVNRESMHFQKIQSFCKHPPRGHTCIGSEKMFAHSFFLHCLLLLLLLLLGNMSDFFSISFSDDIDEQEQLERF